MSIKPIEDILDGKESYFSTRRRGRFLPKSFRSGLSVEEINQLLTERTKQTVPMLDRIEHVHIRGSIGGREVQIELSKYSSHISYYEKGVGGKDRVGFQAEEKDYQHATEHTKITTGSNEDLPRVKRFLEDLDHAYDEQGH